MTYASDSSHVYLLSLTSFNFLLLYCQRLIIELFINIHTLQLSNCPFELNSIKSVWCLLHVALTFWPAGLPLETPSWACHPPLSPPSWFLCHLCLLLISCHRCSMRHSAWHRLDALISTSLTVHALPLVLTLKPPRLSEDFQPWLLNCTPHTLFSGPP